MNQMVNWKTIVGVLVVISLLIYFNSKFSLALGEGDSMNPTFGNCTLLIIEKNISLPQIEIGEIVLVNISGIPTGFDFEKIAHRVVDHFYYSQKIATRGDNDNYYTTSEQSDGYFVYNRILGKVRYYIDLPSFFCNRKD